MSPVWVYGSVFPVTQRVGSSLMPKVAKGHIWPLDLFIRTALAGGRRGEERGELWWRALWMKVQSYR